MFTLAVDFDGTCVEHVYPETGQDVPGAVECLRKLDRAGVQIILWTILSQFIPTKKKPPIGKE
jgi:ribonucleotide monophosphatase NagD (HAD superfamily)